jgi:hypothetical protein
MPLAEHDGLVAFGAEKLGKGLLASVKTVPVGAQAVEMGVLTGENNGPRRGADGISDKAVGEADTFLCDPVDVGSSVDLGSIGGDRVRGVIVREDKDNVGMVGESFGSRDLGIWIFALAGKKNKKKAEGERELHGGKYSLEDSDLERGHSSFAGGLSGKRRKS